MWYSRRIKACAIALCVVSVFLWIPASADNNHDHTVDEPFYGVALFDFFQGKYFSSITDILVAKETNQLIDTNKNSELLMGSLYLSYGMEERAHEIFRNITINSRKDIPKNVLDQAWFYIGKDYYIDGFEESARKALLANNNLHKSNLSPEHESERISILSEIHMHAHEYDEAIKMLELFPEDSVWKQYTQFNLGVNLINNNQRDQGLLLLKKLSEIKAASKESEKLQDQANLAIASSYTKSGDFDLAARYFENIKLSSSQSANALLGLGWAKYKTSSYKSAINTWLELSKCTRANLYAQEALMLIPSALEKQGENDKALAQYNVAVDAYIRELKNIEKVKALIEEGELINLLRLSSHGEGQLDPYDTVEIMGLDLSDYLFELITSSDYKQAVNRYRELIVLKNKLLQWYEALPSLSLILDEKINAYNNRLSKVVNSEKFEQAKKLEKKRKELSNQYQRALATKVKTILLNKQEKELSGVLKKIKNTLDSIVSSDEEIIQIKEKHRFLSGLLEWNVSTDYAPRLWAVKKSIAELDVALEEMQRSITSLTSVWNTAPRSHRGFRKKIKGKKERIEALILNIDQARSEQEKKIQVLAVSAIDQYSAHMKQYLDRALFYRARVYDAMVRNY